jgi:cytochrome c-type biogenesis protein CcmH
MKRARLALIFALTIAASLAHAVQPDEMLADPALEARARTLSAELRCMVCQNQSIDDSDAPLARDIRLMIRDRIAKGESNETVRGFLVSRYGDFILLKPPFKLETLLLWAGAPLALALGVLALWRAARRKATTTPALSEAEEARLAAIAGDGEEEARLPTRDDPALPSMERPHSAPLRHREGAQRRSDPD